MNNDTHPEKTQERTLETCVDGWAQLNSGIRYHKLVDFYSPNAFGTYNLSNEEWDNREMIVNFKNNSELTDPFSHKNALDKVTQLLLPLLNDTFGDLLPTLTLVCIPASTAEKTAARYEEFAKIVTQATGMENGYDHIAVVMDQEHLEDSHLPQYTIDLAFFKGRKVLLFDDIMSTGGSVNKFALHMKEMGADVVAAVVLGKTVSRGRRNDE